MAEQRYPPVPPFSAGLGCRCPRCGRGKLFSGLLTVRDTCDVCGLDLTPHDTGDGPAVFVVMILGAMIVLGAILLEIWFMPPIWSHLIIWPPVILVLSILMLRPMKATLIALHYKNLRHQYAAKD